VARALHRKGPRRDGPFVAINCGAIPESLLESELFGHEKGAFTGASNAHPGCFEQADRGTLFLDEIGEMRPDMQVRLLRVLETREVQRLGATKRTKFDVRVVTATNRDLRERVAVGAFREDLYYRLAIYRLGLPVLKDRESDIVELAERFLLEFSVKLQKRNLTLAPAVYVLLKTYSWPGNVRQLRNAIERATLIARSNQVEIYDFPEEIAATTIDLSALLTSNQLRAVALPPSHDSKCMLTVALEPPVAAMSLPAPDGAHLGGYVSRDEIFTMVVEEKRILERALKITRGDVTEAAKRLDISRATLYRRIKELSLNTDA
jgi:DNA-binding NtrC family response regulator